MSAAEKIMKRKAFIKAEMDKTLPKAQSDVLWKKAIEKLSEILSRYRSLPKGIRTHTDNFIFPSAAVYLTLQEAVEKEKAYSVIENAAISNTVPMGKKLAGLMRLTGMPDLFIRIWDPLTRKMFGFDSGFQNVFYPKKKGEFRMDIIACPYCRYFAELGCPELTKIYCENDDRTYGNLPGLKFERTGTLGKGADRCDFCLKRYRKNQGAEDE